ncbi:hypothetical protein ALO78_200063 [Pseudomonas amygdali pv. ciccaronei]|nr:hypothetical protein ALO78_200063 [Pseudomonas amygdali pv. ciccaronei]
MLACLGALDVFAPLVADDVGLDADLFPVGLNHLCRHARIGVRGALYGHGPQVDFRARCHACFLEQLLCLGQIVRGILDRRVIAPLTRRQGVFGQLTGALVNRFDNRRFIDSHVQRLAHLELIKRRMGDVVGEEPQVEARLAEDLEFRVLFHFFDVLRTRIAADLTFASLELLHAHCGIAADREDQIVDLHVLGLPVLGVARVTDLRVFLVAFEDERASADRLLVQLLGLAFLEQFVCVLGGLDRREAHGQVLHERSVNVVQGELDGQWVDFLDALDRCVQAHVSEVGRFGRVGLAERMVGVEQAVEREQHVVRVECASRSEIVRGVELHAVAQVKRVGQAIRRDVPASSQAWLHFRAATLELGQAVEDGFGRGIEVGAAGVLTGVETGRAGFRAIHQCAGRLGQRCAGQQSGGQQQRFEECVSHGSLA